MALEVWLLFIVVSIVPAMSPGPAILMAMNNTLQYGPRATLVSALGNSMGLLALGFAIAFGLGSIMASSAAVFTIFKLVGAAYLVYLGIKVWRNPSAFSTSSEVSIHSKGSMRLIIEAFFVAVTNPKAIVILAVLYPQFLNADALLMPQVLILSVTFAALCYLNHLLVALFAKRLKTFIKNERRAKITRRLIGGSFMSLGGVLAAASR